MRHALAQEADHLLLLAQVGEQAVEGAGQRRRSRRGCRRRPRPSTSRRAPAPPGSTRRRTGPGDARGRQVGQHAAPATITTSDTSTRLLRNWRKRRHLLGQAAQGQHRAHDLAGGGLERDLRRRRGARRPGRARRAASAAAPASSGAPRAARSAASFGPSDETESCGGCAGAAVEVGDLAVGELADVAGQRLVDAVAGDQHALEVGPGLHGHRHRVEQPVALAPDRGRLLALRAASSPAGPSRGPRPAPPGRSVRAITTPAGSVAMKKSAFSSWLRSLQRVEDRWPGPSRLDARP